MTTAEQAGTDPAEQIATAVASCPSVAGLSGGSFGEVATYLVGRSVKGVRLPDTGAVEVHVTAHWGSPVQTVVAEVRAAVRGVPQAAGRPVDVVIEDLVGAPLPQSPATPSALPAAGPVTVAPATYLPPTPATASGLTPEQP